VPSTNPVAAPAPAAVYDKLLDAHEDRIQGLETVARDTAGILGQHSQRLDELGTKIDSGVAEIGLKIENTVKPLADAISTISTTVAGNAQRVNTLEDNRVERERIAKELEERQKARRAKISALVWSMIGAALTVFVKDGIPVILKLFHQ
jgi:uncharacterized coiled-coil DUF342 family protein